MRSQLARDDLKQDFLSELPTPSTHADADVAKVTIRNAAMTVLRAKVKTRLPRRATDAYYRRERCGAL